MPPSPSSPNRTRAKSRRLAPLDCARRCAELAAERRADHILVLDIRNLSTMADFFVIASADADVQLRAAADRIQEGLEADGEAVWHTEGYEGGQWIVLDYVDVVCHLFLKEKRAFYQLEKLWGDAPRIPVAT